MSEKRFKQDFDGQAIIQSDYNLLGEVSSLADDRLLAELLRMTPFNGSSATRGILRAGHSTSGNTALVAPNGASGSVLVSPFRAVIGGRTAVATDAQKAWRDIRSALSVAEGATALTQAVSLAANASGNPRWDLVYAQVTIDANGPTTSRLVKDPSSGVVAAQTIAQFSRCTVTLGVVTGTAAASPVWPTITSDAGSNYYIPLAYVRVPNGFSASSTVLTKDIAEKAPVLSIGESATGGRVSVQTSSHELSTARQQAWGSSGNRPNIWMPPTMSGGESLIAYLDFSDATSSNWSHQDNDVVDARDWRGRLCFGFVAVRASTGSPPGFSTSLDAAPAWNTAAGAQGFPDSTNPNYMEASGGTNASAALICGQTINSRSGGTQAYVVYADGTSFVGLGNNVVRLYCDFSDGGKLKVGGLSADPGRCHMMFWINWSAPYANK